MPCKYQQHIGEGFAFGCGWPLEHPFHEITHPRFHHGYEEGDTTMATATDPTLGVPTVAPKAPRKVKTSAAPAPVSIATARAASKRRKLTGGEYKDARDFARKTTGYNDTSPIWGKRLIDVLVGIEAILAQQIEYLNTGALPDQIELERALLHNRELQKRIATGQLIAAQS